MIHSSRKQRFVKPGLDLTGESEIKQVLEQILVQRYLVRQLTKLVNILFHSQAPGEDVGVGLCCPWLSWVGEMMLLDLSWRSLL